MIKATKSFVLLKYKILTPDTSTWHLCGTYPKEVQVKWAWRCAADCEHLAKGHPEAEKCIEVAKRYRDGLTTEEELDGALLTAVVRPRSPLQPLRAAYNAAKATDTTRAVYHAALAAYYAVHYAHNAAEEQARKWDLYLSWLVEELCTWEGSTVITFSV